MIIFLALWSGNIIYLKVQKDKRDKCSVIRTRDILLTLHLFLIVFKIERRGAEIIFEMGKVFERIFRILGLYYEISSISKLLMRSKLILIGKKNTFFDVMQ